MQGFDGRGPVSGIARRADTTVRTALHNLYRVPSPDDVPLTEIDSAVLRSATYRRLRPWVIAHRLQRKAILGVKLIHTLIFAALMSTVVYVAYAGLRDRFGRRAILSLAAVVVEAFVVMTNQGRCPLTVVVEDLGAEHGSVSDIFLPGWFARRIPHISSSLIALGFAALAARRVGRRPASRSS